MAKKMDDATRRRVRVGRLLLAGKGCAKVAQDVGVARQTVYTWKALLDEHGIDALRSMGGKGRTVQLDARQLAQLRRILLDSPTAHEFGTELWTLKRLRLLIERMFGVSYSEVHVWHILGDLGFSNQKPERRAIERNEDAVQEFKSKTWPALKKSQAGQAIDCLHRRSRHQRTSDAHAHLGAERPDACDPVSLQLAKKGQPAPS